MPLSLQDSFLNQVRTKKIPVDITLMGGFNQYKGLITGFDQSMVLLDMKGKKVAVYKHAIATITPQGPVDLFRAETMQDLEAGKTAQQQ